MINFCSSFLNLFGYSMLYFYILVKLQKMNFWTLHLIGMYFDEREVFDFLLVVLFPVKNIEELKSIYMNMLQDISFFQRKRSTYL